MAAVRHLEFSKFGILVIWPVLKRDYALSYKCRVNRTIIRQDIAKRGFSIWRPSAILNLKNFGILLSSRPWNHNPHLHTKFR